MQTMSYFNKIQEKTQLKTKPKSSCLKTCAHWVGVSTEGKEAE